MYHKIQIPPERLTESLWVAVVHRSGTREGSDVGLRNGALLSLLSPSKKICSVVALVYDVVLRGLHPDVRIFVIEL